MNAFKVNRDSWHYKTISMTKDPHDRIGYWRERWEPTDFCSYWRAFAFSILKIVFIVGFITAFIAFFLVVAWTLITAMIANPAGGFGVIGFFALIFGTLYGTRRLYVWNKTRERTVREPGIIATKYKSWKESYCPMVEYD